jgi:hypothetical protein
MTTTTTTKIRSHWMATLCYQHRLAVRQARTVTWGDIQRIRTVCWNCVQEAQWNLEQALKELKETT